VVNWDKLPVELEKTASSNDVIMGIRHKRYVVEGVQFHPESIMTDVGHSILNNFLKYTAGVWPK
jgi:anthranilate/para-aminobenzoate synthase component II